GQYLKLRGCIEAEEPNRDLYSFNGCVRIDGFSDAPAACDNLLLRGSVLRDTKSLIGVVVYTGNETKTQINQTQSQRVKAPQIQRIINYAVLCVFLLLIFFVLILSILTHVTSKKRLHHVWYLSPKKYNHDIGVTPATVFRYIVMLNTFIPISLYV